MPSLPDPFGWLPGSLAELDRHNLRRTLTQRATRQGATLELDGEQLVNFGANDYLGLAADQRLADAAARAIAQEGWGAGASPLVTGRSRLHAELEHRLASFEGAEAALVFPAGFAANAGVIPALVDRGDAILSDAKNHASLIDGCRLARATTHVYRHGDANHLEQLLRDATGRRRRLIVTDTLFSMDGDLAPLAAIAELAVRYDAMLLVDEAHATGVWGRRGRGVVEHVEAECPALARCALVRVGTLSKALGCAGGFVTGGQSLIDYLANRARSYVFSTAGPAANCAAAIAALDIVQAEPERRSAVLALGEQLRCALKESGWCTGASQSQIVPIMLGDNHQVMHASALLRKQGLLVPGIRPPTVPPGEALLRVSLSAAHTPQHLQRLLGGLSAVRAELGLP